MRNKRFNYMSKTIVSLVLVASVLGTTTVQAAESIKKDESVYVTLTHQGEVKERIVSDWIYNPTGSDISDKSSLKDIKNVKGDEKPEVNGENLTWKLKDNNLFYQGKTDKDLPLDVKVTYTLDGQEVNAKDIAGKSGSLKIKVDIKNKESHKITVNGKEKTIYTPFTAVTLLNLPLENFKNVKVNSGEVVSDGNNSIITFISLPGLKESLDIDKDLVDLDLEDTLEVTADAENFKLGPIMITATPNLPDAKAFKEAKNIDELKDGINELKDASTKLKDGAQKLSDGEKLLAEKMGDLVSGVDKLNSGSKALKDGASQLNAGITLAGNGVNKLSQEMNSKSNKEKLALITDNDKVKRERTLIAHAYYAKDMDTSMVKPLMTSIPTAGKTVTDVQFLQLITAPLVEQLKDLNTPENVSNIKELLVNAEKLGVGLSDVDIKKLEPIVKLMNNKDQYMALMNYFMGLSTINTAPIKSMLPLLDNAAQIRGLLGSVGELSKVDIASMQKFIEAQKTNGAEFVKKTEPLLKEDNINALNAAIDKAYPADNDATKAINAQLKGLVNGYVSAVKETKDNAVNSAPALDQASKNLAMLAALQKGLKDNAGTIDAAAKALSDENVKEINKMVAQLKQVEAELSKPENQKLIKDLTDTLKDKELMNEIGKIEKVAPQIESMLNSLDKNKQNIQALKAIIAKVEDPELNKKLLSSLNEIEKDINELAPVMKAIENNLTNDSLSKAGKDLTKLLDMQNDLKKSEDILKVMRESLEENNVKDARAAIAKLPELTKGFKQLQSGSNQLYNGLVELNGGTNTLSDGSRQLKHGADELSKGASELSEGMNKFDQEGITKLHDEVSGKVDDVKDILDTKDEIVKLSENYGTFTGMGEGMEGKVKFVMKTDEIKLPEVKKEETKTVKQEKKGFIQWIKNLFSK